MMTPPRLAKALLRRCIPEGLPRDSTLGDLEEAYVERVRLRSARYAAAWYWLQSYRLGVRYLVERTVNRHLYAPPLEGKPSRKNLLESTIQDLHFALRTLRRRPLFATVAVVTLGLGIGAATAMFTVVDGVLLKPLPYEDPGRLVAIWQTWPDAEGRDGNEGLRWDRYTLTYSQYRHLSENSTVYDGLATYKAYISDGATLTGVGAPVELRVGAGSASLLPVLGIRPVLGRWFLPGEEATLAGNDGASVAVISHEVWRGRFGGAPETLGMIITVDDRPFTIVGVLPADFRIHWLTASVVEEGDPGKREIWFPIGAPGRWGMQGAYSWETVGRLASGVTLEQARAETEAIMSEHPRTAGDVRVLGRMAEETRGLAPPLVLLFGATGFLLLLSCANIATLSMAELQGRRHEITTRSALGAGASRLVRLFLTEGAVLAVLGSAVGAAFASAGTGFLVALAPPMPRLGEVGVDLRAFTAAAVLGTCAALLFGTVPSIVASRSDITPSLRRSARVSNGRQRFSGTVVGLEIALTVMLLVAATLLTRSLSLLLAVDPGFNTKNLVTLEVRAPDRRYPTREARDALFRELLGRLEAIPGVGTVTGVSRLPFPGISASYGIRIEGREYSSPNVWEERVSPLFFQVVPGYFETLGVPLLAGRSLAQADGPGAPLSAVINETMARRYWPDESPIGARFYWNPENPITVVGIVGDMKRAVLEADIEPAWFIPFSQLPEGYICFVARTDLDPREIIPLMREAVWSVDGELAVKNATTMEALIAESAADERFRTVLMNVFGILAALLAAAGVFGVTARSVALRTREMGIRMALGMRESELVWATVKNSLFTGLAGAAVGLVGALWTSRLLSRFLFEIAPSDPTTYGVVTVLIVVVCLLASYVPARRITSVNPVEVLSAE